MEKTKIQTYKHYANFAFSYLDFSPFSPSNVCFDSDSYRAKLTAHVIQFCDGWENLNIKTTIPSISG